MRPIKRDHYVIRSGEIRHIAKPRVSMAALQWAADRAGLVLWKVHPEPNAGGRSAHPA